MMINKAINFFADLSSRAFSYLLHLIFPPKCVICNSLILESGELCPECLEIWKQARLLKCPVCSKTAKACTCRLFSLMATDSIGERRLSSLAFFGKSDSDDKRDLLVRKLVYTVKTDTNLDAARFCARELSRDILKTMLLAKEAPSDWKLTYPPRSKRRIKKYGFDQGRDLTKLISKYTGIPIEETLVNKGSQTQKKLNALERQKNAKDSYELKKGIIPGGKYIIIDDVITTGATVNNAALLLKNGGALAVYPVCISRTKNKKRKVRRPSQRPWFRSK